MNLSNMAVHLRYSVFRECSANGWMLKTRTIHDNEFVLITGGKGFTVIEGKEHKLRPGNLLYFYPGLLHSMESCNESPMSFYGLHFSVASLEYLNNQWKVRDDISVLSLPPVMEIKNYPFVLDIMKRINQHFSKAGNDTPLFCNGLFLQLLYFIFKDFKLNSFNYASRQKIEAAICFITDNLDKKISAVEISDMLGISSDYLSVLFKSYTGLSLTRYINKSRIDAAKALLTEKNIKIKDVAVKTGFCDEFYFSRVFKKHEGISPVQFCKNAVNTG